MTVAIGWSGYMQRLLAGAGVELPLWMTAAPSAATPGTLINVPVVFAMSRDGLLPPPASKVHPRFGTPYITTIITCVIVAFTAEVLQIQVVGETLAG